jgi:integrase
MPRRYSTARGYETWLRVHIVPKWGAEKIGNVKPADVKDWLDSLALAPKSRVHIRWLMAKLFDCAMLWEMMPVQRNPLSVFKLKDSSKRQREPRILTAPEFSRLLLVLVEPFRTMAVVAGCLGLRFCEVAALQWGDVDWLEKVIRIQRAVVNQHNGDVKTVHSRKPLPLEDSLIALLEQYHASVEQKDADDWLFGSPAQAFEKPFSYTWCHDNLIEAGKNAGIGHIGWHDLRHTYRTWLNVVGAPMAVQQKLMRHADIRTTMNTYGDTMPEELREAHGKVVRMVLPS